MKLDYSIIGKENGKGLIASIKEGKGPEYLTPEEFAFLRHPESAAKQRAFKSEIEAAIRSGELQATGVRPH